LNKVIKKHAHSKSAIEEEEEEFEEGGLLRTLPLSAHDSLLNSRHNFRLRLGGLTHCYVIVAFIIYTLAVALALMSIKSHEITYRKLIEYVAVAAACVLLDWILVRPIVFMCNFIYSFTYRKVHPTSDSDSDSKNPAQIETQLNLLDNSSHEMSMISKRNIRLDDEEALTK